MASGVRYRFKGHFISASKAAKLGNLPSTKKYLKTEYTIEKKTSSVRSGFKKSIQDQVKEALKKERAAAEIKRHSGKSSQQVKRERAAEEKKRMDFLRARSFAEDAAKFAAARDISVPEAFDAMGFGDQDFGSNDFDHVSGMAQDFLDYDQEMFDFEMADLEDEDKYHS